MGLGLRRLRPRRRQASRPPATPRQPRHVILRSPSVPDGARFRLAWPEEAPHRDRVAIYLAAPRLERALKPLGRGKIDDRDREWLKRFIDCLLPVALPDSNEFIRESLKPEDRAAVVMEFLYGEEGGG